MSIPLYVKLKPKKSLITYAGQQCHIKDMLAGLLMMYIVQACQQVTDMKSRMVARIT
jgi:hypothetical protein